MLLQLLSAISLISNCELLREPSIEELQTLMPDNWYKEFCYKVLENDNWCKLDCDIPFGKKVLCSCGGNKIIPWACTCKNTKSIKQINVKEDICT